MEPSTERMKIIKIDPNSPEWKARMEKLNQQLEQKEGSNRHKLVEDDLYNKYREGFTSTWP